MSDDSNKIFLYLKERSDYQLLKHINYWGSLIGLVWVLNFK